MVMGGMLFGTLNNVSISNNYVVPGSIFIDNVAGIMYTTEGGRIRAISLSTNIISTVVGTGTIGILYTNDPKTTQVYTPTSLTRWKTHLIWIDGNYKIRKLDSTTNEVSVIFGGGYGNSDNTVVDPLLVQTGASYSITIDPSYNIFYGDYTNGLIRKIDGTTNVASVYKSSLLGLVRNIKYCNGALYVSIDNGATSFIQKLIEVGGVVSVSTVVGGGSSKATGISGTSYLMDSTNYVLQVDCFNSNLYWTAADNAIRKLTPGGIVEHVLGNGYRGESPDGTITPSSITGSVNYLTVNSANGELYFVENGLNIRKLVGTTISSFFHYRNVLAERDPKTLPLYPSAISVTSDGIGLHMADTNSIKFYNFTSSTIKHFAGYYYLPYSNLAPNGSDNIGGSYVTARYASIQSIISTPSGDVYLMDNSNSVSFIKLLSKSTGLVTVVAGASSGSTCTNGDTPTACTVVLKNLQYYNGEVYFASDTYIYKINSTTGKVVVILDNSASILYFTIRPSDGNIYYFQKLSSTLVHFRVFRNSTVTTMFSLTDGATYKDFYVTNNGAVFFTYSGTQNFLKLFTPNSTNAYTGSITTYSGNNSGTLNDGESLANTRFNGLKGLTFLENSNSMIIADSGSLRKIYMECDSNYGGAYCDIPYCYSIRSDNSTVCNSHGNCTTVDSCSCTEGYFGSNCSSWTCDGILNSDISICSSHGICDSYNTCSCSSNYYGFNCSVTTCDKIFSNSSEVCSGNGVCEDYNLCNCSTNYYGSNCSITTCYELFSNSTEVCSGRGLCLSLNNCSCQSGYFGNECQLFTCNGILPNLTQVCSSRGLCSSPNNCTCREGYSGDECQFTSCYGVSFNNSQVCSGHGVCNLFNNCTCDIGYFGNDCSSYQCFGILNTNSSVCSGSGNCTTQDTCMCQDGFTGLICNATISNNNTFSNISYGNTTVNNTELNNTSNFTISNSSSSVFVQNITNNTTSSNLTIANTTSLNDTLYFNQTTTRNNSLNDTFNFNETKLNNTSSQNSTYANETITNPPLPKQNTSSTSNMSLIQNNTNIPFNNTDLNEKNSTIISNISSVLFNSTTNTTFLNDTLVYLNESNTNNVSITINSTNFTSSNDSSTFNDTKLSNSSSFNTNETKLNNTSQNSTYTNETIANPPLAKQNTSSTSNTSITQNSTCNGNISNLICNGNGMCLSNQCSCDYGYAGSVCELKMCFGILSSDSGVCNGRGVCSNINTCDCFSGISGVKIMGDACETLLCKGAYHDQEYFFSDMDSRVCSNHGKCLIDSKNSSGGCECDSGYYGASCNKYDCFSEPSTSVNVCSGHGTCVSPDACQCVNDDTKGHYAGFDCKTCHSAFTGPSCKDKTCTASTCLNGGSCGGDNQCVCAGNFTGLVCEECKLDYYGLNCNRYCNYETTCNGHGFCDLLNGNCQCFSNRADGYWNGTNCNSCQGDYYGADCLTRFDSFNSSYSPSSLSGQVSKYFDGILFKLFGTTLQNTISCSKLIHPNDISLFGSEPKCYWTDKLNGDFKIEFDNDFTFDITKVFSIRLNTNVFSNTLIDYGYIRMYLLLSDNIKAPTANIKPSKKVYSTSETIYLSGSNSFSGDKKGLEYYWSISGQNTQLNILQSITATKDQILKIQKDQLTSGTYIISLFVKSQVSKLASSTESVTIQVQDVEFPSISILNKELSVKSTDQFITIKKITSIPISLKEKEMKIEWQQVEGPSTKFKKDSYNNLVIEQLSNGKWKYVFKVSISVVENPTLSSNDLVVINAEQPKLSLSLSLKQSSRISNSIQVNFQDPENNLEENELWRWYCSDSATLGYCGDTIYENLAMYSKNRSTIISLSLQDFPSYVISPSLTLLIMKGDRSVYSSLDLNIQHSPPIINIISISPNLRNIVTNDDKISIEMKHQDQDPSDSSLFVKTQWSINNLLVSESSTKKVKENDIVTTSSPIKTNFKNLRSLNKNQQSSLVIDSKELEDGVDHSIQVKVSFVDSNTDIEMASTSNVNSFTKASPPRKCPCSISPPTGVSMRTDFTFSCENCQNEDNTIEIKQGYIDQETGIKVYLPLSLDGSVNIPSSSTTSSKRRVDDHNVQLFIEIGDKTTGESRVMLSNITVLPPPQPTLSEILNLVSNQTSKIMSTSIQDGNTASSIADTLNTIVSTSQLLQTLSSNEKETSTVTQVQSKLLDTLSSSLQTTESETVSSSTASMAVLALHSVVKNEQVIEKPVIQKSITILNHVIQLSLKSKVDVFTETSKPLLSIVGVLSNQVSKLIILKEKFYRFEEIASIAERMTLSYVSTQPVSGDPAAIHESAVNVKADKMYLTDFSNSMITSPPDTSGRRENVFQSFVNIPSMKVTENNEFAELTYSLITKEHVPSIYQKNLNIESNNSTTNGTESFEVISSVSTSLTISSPHAHMIDFSQNMTINVNVNDVDFSKSTLSDYSCVLVNSNLESDFGNCTTSGRDMATDSIACNCRFIDLQISNLIILKNKIQKAEIIDEQKQDDVMVIIIVVIVSCIGLPVLSVSVIMGVFACYVCLKKKKSKKINPYETRELISHNIVQPAKISNNSLISTSSISIL